VIFINLSFISVLSLSLLCFLLLFHISPSFPHIPSALLLFCPHGVRTSIPFSFLFPQPAGRSDPFPFRLWLRLGILLDLRLLLGSDGCRFSLCCRYFFSLSSSGACMTSFPFPSLRMVSGFQLFVDRAFFASMTKGKITFHSRFVLIPEVSPFPCSSIFFSPRPCYVALFLFLSALFPRGDEPSISSPPQNFFPPVNERHQAAVVLRAFFVGVLYFSPRPWPGPWGPFFPLVWFDF